MLGNHFEKNFFHASWSFVSHCKRRVQKTALASITKLVSKGRKEIIAGFTLLELMVVVAILGTIAAIAIPAYSTYINKARITKAIGDIGTLQKDIMVYELGEGSLPDTLNDIGWENLLDPYGHPYQYLNFATMDKGKGKKRKDQWLVPLNTDYDLYSMGRDGESVAPLTADASHDDIVRADDGRFIGLASEF